MYIPSLARVRDDVPGASPAETTEWGSHLRPAVSPAGDDRSSFVTDPGSVFRPVVEAFSGLDLRRRDGMQSQNVTIGVVIGVALALFIVAVIFFLYRYRFSVRFTNKKKRRHHSGSSKSSHTSASSASSHAAAPAG